MDYVADADTESSVLASALLDSGALDAIRTAFGSTDGVFFSDANQRVWEAIVSLDDDGAPIDLPSVLGRLRETGRLEQVGGSGYLAKLATDAAVIGQVDFHARRLADLALTRRMVSACQVAVTEARSGAIDSAKWARRKADEIQDTIGTDASRTVERDMHALMKLILAEVSALRSGQPVAGATPTGWGAVDNLLGGWLDGNFYIAAGRPGMGKTSLALQAVLNVAESGNIGLFLGLEMPDVQVAQRALSIRSGIPVTRIIRGAVNGPEQSQMMAAAQALARLPVFVGDNCGQTVAQLRATVRRQVRRLRGIHGEGTKIGLIAIDYLQLVKTTYKQGRSRENEVSEVSGALKMMASEFKAPVLALSQLSRKCEERPDKRPMLSDLRESGSLEQDAYGIAFLYRDEYYNRENSREPGVCEMNIAKHRNGPTGVVKLDFNAELTRFDEMAEQYGDFASAASSPMPGFEEQN